MSRPFLKKVAEWLSRHLVVRSRDLNKREDRERDEERRQRKAAEVLFKWEF